MDGYPIREFSKLTGVNPVTLRAWERRYGIIRPMRTQKGHRYYTDEHVEIVRNILYWIEQGYPIRQVKLLLQAPAEESGDSGEDWRRQQDQLLRAANQFNARALDDQIHTGLACYPMAVYWERCLLPVLEHLRADTNAAPALRSFEYLLKRKLNSLVALQQKHAEGKTLLMATNHADAELQVLALAYALGAAGFRVEYFGSQLIPDDIRIAVPVVSVSWLWVHVHPSTTDDIRSWQSLCGDAQVPVYLSGALDESAAAGQQSLNTHVLPDRTSAMVSQFITTSGEEL